MNLNMVFNYVLHILLIDFDCTKKRFLKFFTNQKSRAGVDEA